MHAETGAESGVVCNDGVEQESVFPVPVHLNLVPEQIVTLRTQNQEILGKRISE